MSVLKMKGIPITNIILFYKYFNPYDILNQRDLFIEFAHGHLALNDESKYCIGMFQTAHLMKKPRYLCKNIGDEKEDCPLSPADCNNEEFFWENPFDMNLRDIMLTKENIEEGTVISDDIYHWCELNLSAYDKKAQICVLLTSIYLLSGNSLRDYPLDKQRVLEAFKRINTKTTVTRKECVLPTTDNNGITNVVLTPDSKPYKCPFFEEPFITGKHRIRTYRIEAANRITTDKNVEVIIKTGTLCLRIKSGNHIYVNAVDGKIISVLSDVFENGLVRIERTKAENDRLNVFFNGEQRILRFAENQYITSFASGINSNSILYICNNRLCTTYFAQSNSFPELSVIQERTVVEVMIIGNDYYILQDTGKVYSSNNYYNGKKNVAALSHLFGGTK